MRPFRSYVDQVYQGPGPVLVIPRIGACRARTVFVGLHLHEECVERVVLGCGKVLEVRFGVARPRQHLAASVTERLQFEVVLAAVQQFLPGLDLKDVCLRQLVANGEAELEVHAGRRG